MPLVSLFEGIEIYMYNNGCEHNPPHFHAVFGEFECLVDIGKVKRIEGKFPRNKLRMVLVWCELHKIELLENWNKCVNCQELIKIKPLS